jgi:methylmalonyl-CoA mutase
MLRTHCQTSGWSLTEQDPLNNVVRTTIEAMAGVFGGTQSLHTNSFDEAISLPTETSSRIARNTQIMIQEETDITHTVDPFGGSYAVESMTHDLKEKAKSIIREIDGMGGMAKAIEEGYPKRKIEEAAAVKQASIDKGETTIVGVNKYLTDKDDPVEVRDIDNTQVREKQLKRIDDVKKSRNSEEVKAALQAITDAAKNDEGNLLELAVEATRQRATIGEISDAMEVAFGRHRADNQTIKGVYERVYAGDEAYESVKKKINDFAKEEGRRPRILVVKMGQDGHDRGAKVVATAFADLGFDVDVGPLFSTPEEAAKQAIENDVHVIGVSTLAAGHKTLIPELINILKKEMAEDIVIIAGGVIPKQDYDFLYKKGVSAVFGPGTNIPKAAAKVIDAISEKKALV